MYRTCQKIDRVSAKLQSLACELIDPLRFYFNLIKAALISILGMSVSILIGVGEGRCLSGRVTVVGKL